MSSLRDGMQYGEKVSLRETTCYSRHMRCTSVMLVKEVWNYVVSERLVFDVNLLHRACRLRETICRIVNM